MTIEVNHQGLLIDLALSEDTTDLSTDELRVAILSSVAAATADAESQVGALRATTPEIVHPTDRPSVVIEFLERMSASAGTAQRGER